ncbi:hypothetical protein LJC72_03590 [Bacteroides sp. OttesenSCG-928-D19]|nr:hypothetical protein [Bacteroides sp. OttesenSCG-928-D19]
MKKQPTKTALYEATRTEFTAKEGMTLAEFKDAINAEYEAKVKRYFGQSYPAFREDGATPEELKARETFKQNLINQGRLPNE